jgi:AcrR family transcriptional regulator
MAALALRNSAYPLPGADNSVTQRNRKRNRSGRERQLILAATKLFASRGYEATTTREIAALAGCAEGLIHRYFKGKAGLLFALIRFRVSQEAGKLSTALPPAPTLEEEFLQLVDWEVQRMWEDRDFFRVIVPRALVDAKVSRMADSVATSQRPKAIATRFLRFKNQRGLSNGEVESLAQCVGMLGFAFGFVRPVVLGQNRIHARKTANLIAKMLVRGL